MEHLEGHRRSHRELKGVPALKCMSTDLSIKYFLLSQGKYQGHEIFALLQTETGSWSLDSVSTLIVNFRMEANKFFFSAEALPTVYRLVKCQTCAKWFTFCNICFKGLTFVRGNRLPASGLSIPEGCWFWLGWSALIPTQILKCQGFCVIWVFWKRSEAIISTASICSNSHGKNLKNFHQI